MIYIYTFCLIILILNTIFHIAWRIKFSRWYKNIPKVPFKKIYIEPHPYLPFIYKKNFRCQKQTKAQYPYLDKKIDAFFPELTSNNFRHINGENGNRDVEIPKPKKFTNCIGGSTTTITFRLEILITAIHYV